MSTRLVPVLIVLLAVTTGVVAQLSSLPAGSADDEPVTISLELQGAKISVVLDLIAKQGGMNLIVSDEVRGRVSATLKEVPWLDALEAIVKTTGHTCVVEEIGSTSFIRISASRDENENGSIVAATSELDDAKLEVIHGTVAEPTPFLPDLFPVSSTEPSPRALDVPVTRNRSTSQTVAEHTLALALLDYLQQSMLTTPLPTRI